MPRVKYMVVDPGPGSTPGQCVRKVNPDKLPEFVTLNGHRFPRTELRPRYYDTYGEAFRAAAKRVVRDIGAPGGLTRGERASLSPEERADLRDLKKRLKKKYGVK